eukprot:gnl/Spiro4/29399_TR14396_c0_g1_i1.p1 gnl/Spiro4/29399_TR14396_c0_g1~~gnl/Spiro4/29399_TR14396_c0_g1_i1.p1  ORF type:complete len:599 (+),score=139.08 gnl/Spiro4/29399_TR14396_c0_g1_i1:92-1798(+)
MVRRLLLVIAVVLFFICWSRSSSETSFSSLLRAATRGIISDDDKRVVALRQNLSWTCAGTNGLDPISVSLEQFNDDYCDCVDGSDEPGTSACAFSTFSCRNLGHVPKTISASKVNDGVCDCCDGSDEWLRGACVSTCLAEGAEARARTVRTRDDAVLGARIREGYIAQAVLNRRLKALELECLRAELAVLELQQSLNGATPTRAPSPPVDSTDPTDPTDLADTDLADTDPAENADPAQPAPPHSLTDHVPAPPDQPWMEGWMRGESLHHEAPSVRSSALPAAGEGGCDSAGVCSAIPAPDPIAPAPAHQPPHMPSPHVHAPLPQVPPPHASQVRAQTPPIDTQPPAVSSASTPPTQNSETADKLRAAQAHLLEKQEQASAMLSELGWWHRIRTLLASAWRYLPSWLTSFPAQPSVEHSVQQSKLRNDIAKLEKLLAVDAGASSEYFTLVDECTSYDSREYSYQLCFFDKVMQRSSSDSSSVHLGSWDRWGGGGTIMHFSHGAMCPGGPERSVSVTVECGPRTVLSAVTEPDRCVYTARLATPAACVESVVAALDAAVARDEAALQELA